MEAKYQPHNIWFLRFTISLLYFHCICFLFFVKFKRKKKKIKKVIVQHIHPYYWHWFGKLFQKNLWEFKKNDPSQVSGTRWVPAILRGRYENKGTWKWLKAHTLSVSLRTVWVCRHQCISYNTISIFKFLWNIFKWSEWENTIKLFIYLCVFFLCWPYILTRDRKTRSTYFAAFYRSLCFSRLPYGILSDI